MINDKYKVSVIITSFNHEKYIQECIDSVYNQTYKNIEIILIDGASEDSTLDIVKRTYPDITILLCPQVLELSKKKYTGEAIQRNRGLANAHGEFIQFLDGDDYLYPHAIQERVEVFSKLNDEYCLVYSNLNIIDEAGNNIAATVESLGNKEGYAFSEILNGNFIPIHSAMYRKSHLSKQYVFNEKLILAPDWLFHINLLYEYKIKFINAIHGVYRKHSANLTNKKDFLYKSYIQTYNIIVEHKEKFNFTFKQLNKIYLNEAYLYYLLGEKNNYKKKIYQALRKKITLKGLWFFLIFNSGLSAHIYIKIKKFFQIKR